LGSGASSVPSFHIENPVIGLLHNRGGGGGLFGGGTGHCGTTGETVERTEASSTWLWHYLAASPSLLLLLYLAQPASLWLFTACPPLCSPPIELSYMLPLSSSGEETD